VHVKCVVECTWCIGIPQFGYAVVGLKLCQLVWATNFWVSSRKFLWFAYIVVHAISWEHFKIMILFLAKILKEIYGMSKMINLLHCQNSQDVIWILMVVYNVKKQWLPVDIENIRLLMWKFLSQYKPITLSHFLAKKSPWQLWKWTS